MDPVHGCDAVKYIERGTEQNRMVDLCILNLKFFSPNCTEMKYKLIKTQKMANLQEHNVTALFVFENRGDRLDLSNPDIFSQIITFHYIILRLAKTVHMPFIHICYPRQTRRTVRVSRRKK